jgi:hypothetical protein
VVFPRHLVTERSKNVVTANVKTVKRVLVSLNLPTKAAFLMETATALVSSMTSNLNLSPGPPLASLTAAVGLSRESSSRRRPNGRFVHGLLRRLRVAISWHAGERA